MIPTISKLIFHPPFTYLLNDIPKLTINNKNTPGISAISISNTHIQMKYMKIYGTFIHMNRISI